MTQPSHKKRSRPGNRWVAKVTTDSTHPPAGLFNQSAATIAKTLASKKVSPKGPGSGMRMLTPQHSRVQHVWEREVTHEGPVAGHQPGVFKPFDGLAYVAHPHPP